MLVEFVGVTGSGKTTLIRHVERRLAGTVPVTTAADAATALVGLSPAANPTLQNLIEEFVGAPFVLRSFARYRPYLACTGRFIARNATLGVQTVNGVRSVLRKAGVDAICTRVSPDHIVLVDEGPLLAAHLFVDGRHAFAPRDLARFIAAAPMPDAIVHVRAPLELVVRRTRARPDAPRHLRTADPVLVATYVEAAAALLDRVVAAAAARCPVLILVNPDPAEPSPAVAVERVVAFLMHRRLACPSGPAQERHAR